MLGHQAFVVCSCFQIVPLSLTAASFVVLKVTAVLMHHSIRS